MSKPNPIPERVTKLEQQMSEVHRNAEDAFILARHADRDVSDVRVELRAHRELINALQETQVERFNKVGERFDKVEGEMREGFREMREGFSMLGVRMAQITALLTIAQEKSDD